MYFTNSVPQWNNSVKVGGLETGSFTGLCYGLESASFLRYWPLNILFCPTRLFSWKPHLLWQAFLPKRICFYFVSFCLVDKYDRRKNVTMKPRKHWISLQLKLSNQTLKYFFHKFWNLCDIFKTSSPTVYAWNFRGTFIQVLSVQ